MRALVAAMVLIGLLASRQAGPDAPVLASDGARAQAVLGGERVPLVDVAQYHCHDRDLPLIRCFLRQVERDDDLAQGFGVALLGDPYVTFYRDVDYGGTSYTALSPIPSLGSLGWNDLISSFKSLNGGRPHWYRDANYGTPDWRWSAGAWVPNVGSGANDAISSVENDP